MGNSFGTCVTFTLFGESHGDTIGGVLDGLSAGLPVCEEHVRHWLSLRRPAGCLSTARVEEDAFRFVSGVYNGYTTGAPVALLLDNTNINRQEYASLTHTPRPGHADYTASVKYRGFADLSGGGHFSGRLTAPLVGLGAIVYDALKAKGIRIGTHVALCGGIEDVSLSENASDWGDLENRAFPVLDAAAEENMKRLIQNAALQGDSVGGIMETVVTGMPAGIGEPWFDGVENKLAQALFGIPAVKGVAFGDGFGFGQRPGHEVSDGFRFRGGHVVTEANHNGGINGGITNGMPIRFSCAVKPTPSLGQVQHSVNLQTGDEVDLTVGGRHDSAIIARFAVIQNAVTALVLADLLALHYGTDWPAV